MLLNDKNYKENLKGTCVVEVSGESCANCLSLMPVLNDLVSKRNDVVLHHVEVDDYSMGFVQEYEIYSVPTILILKDGREVSRCRGFQPEEIWEVWLKAKI